MSRGRLTRVLSCRSGICEGALPENVLDVLAGAVLGRMDCVSRGTDLWWMWSDLVLMKYAARTDARPYREHGETDVFQLTEMGREVGIRWRTLQALKEKGEK